MKTLHGDAQHRSAPQACQMKYLTAHVALSPKGRAQSPFPLRRTFLDLDARTARLLDRSVDLKVNVDLPGCQRPAAHEPQALFRGQPPDSWRCCREPQPGPPGNRASPHHSLRTAGTGQLRRNGWINASIGPISTRTSTDPPAPMEEHSPGSQASQYGRCLGGASAMPEVPHRHRCALQTGTGTAAVTDIDRCSEGNTRLQGDVSPGYPAAATARSVERAAIKRRIPLCRRKVRSSNSQTATGHHTAGYGVSHFNQVTPRCDVRRPCSMPSQPALVTSWTLIPGGGAARLRKLFLLTRRTPRLNLDWGFRTGGQAGSSRHETSL